MPPDTDAWFVDERVNILRGKAAEDAIRARSDAAYVKEGEGISSVPRERWQVAQSFERTGWMEKWGGLGDDRNLQHAQDFYGYQALGGAGRTYQHAIELGCGPFTNLRVIADVVPISRISLLDPLMESYLTLPTCAYSRTALRTHFHKKTIPVEETFPLPIEDMPVGVRRYDLVIMINVIEHCIDIRAIFAKILAITEPGSMFVFHDTIYDAARVDSSVRDRYYEAGHPLLVAYPVLRAFMDDHFEPYYFRRTPRPADQIDASPMIGRFYFIGQRR